MRGGLGAQVKEVAWEHRAECALNTFGLKDEFIHVYGTPADMWEAHGLSVENIMGAQSRLTGGPHELIRRFE